MSNSKISFSILLFLFAIYGCAAVIVSPTDRAIGSGRYAAVESEQSDRAKDLSQARSEEIIDLCHAYYKLKKYGPLSLCLDRLEANIAAGDDKVFRSSRNWSLVSGLNLRSAGNYPETITAWPQVVRAEVDIDFGDYAQAAARAEKALAMVETIPWLPWESFNNWPKRMRIRALGALALAQALAGNRQQAGETVRRLESTEVGFAAMLPAKKEKCQQLARAYMALESYEKVLELETPVLDALGSFAETFIFGSKLIGDDIFAFVDLPLHFMFAKALHETGRLAEARAGYDELLAHPSIAQNGDIYWMLLFERGRITEAEGDTEAAWEFFRKAVEIIEQQRSSINTEASKIGFVGNKQAVYFRAVGTLLTLGRQELAFEYVERAKSRALVDLLSSQDRLSPPGAETVNLAASFAQAELDAKAQTGGGEAEAAKTRGLKIREEIRTKAPDLYSLITVSTPPADELQALLAPDETLLEYFGMGERLLVFVVTRGGIAAHRLDGRGLTGDVLAFREALTRPDSPTIPALSRGLYERLIGPVEAEIGTAALVVVPHGIMHRLPFCALHDGDRFLLDRFAISYLPSCNVLRFIRDGRAARSGAVLVLGNPDLGDPGLALKNAEDEAVRVGSLFAESRVLLRETATETSFKELEGGFGVVHFACHGVFSQDQPLFSGLLLRKDDRNDGRLTAGELYTARMDTDLVTLSACETGVGDIQGGDDVIGLTRGFLYAGSRSVVASLWPVDDKATADLMATFYRRLSDRDRRTALQQAQIDVRRGFPHPYYWAAFKLIGRPGP